MTPEDLQRLQDLARKATPGPWAAECDDQDGNIRSRHVRGARQQDGAYGRG